MGKGSKWRETDYKKYFDNWEKIEKKDKKEKEIIKSKTTKKGKTTYVYK